MGNVSLGTLAISMSLWAVDLGAGHYGAALAPSAPQSELTRSRCESGVQAATDDSDLEVGVCSKPLP